MGTISSEFIAAVFVGMHIYAINNCGNKSVIFRVTLLGVTEVVV